MRYLLLFLCFSATAAEKEIYINQAGNSNEVSITQSGTAGNEIQGLDGATSSSISGNSNTVEIKQGSTSSIGSNLIEYTILGGSNDIVLYQDRLDAGTQATSTGGDHDIKLDIDGYTNNIDIIQRSNYNIDGGHLVNLEVTGDSNVVDLKQIGDHSKTIDGTVSGDSNNILVRQRGGEHKYLEFDLIGNGHDLSVTQAGAGNHNLDITLTYGLGSIDADVTQQGDNSKSYTLEQTCQSSSGCSVSVTQSD